MVSRPDCGSEDTARFTREPQNSKHWNMSLESAKHERFVGSRPCQGSCEVVAAPMKVSDRVITLLSRNLEEPPYDESISTHRHSCSVGTSKLSYDPVAEKYISQPLF